MPKAHLIQQIKETIASIHMQSFATIKDPFGIKNNNIATETQRLIKKQIRVSVY